MITVGLTFLTAMLLVLISGWPTYLSGDYSRLGHVFRRRTFMDGWCNTFLQAGWPSRHPIDSVKALIGFK